jgi:hypothetical protein
LPEQEFIKNHAMEQSGIYIAKSKMEPQKAFIFPAIDKDLSWNRHLESLLSGKHPNKKLQAHFKENPGDEFTVELIRPCQKTEFSNLEAHFIKRLRPFFNSKSKGK